MTERNIERKLSRERVVVKCDSKEDAVAFVKEFWKAVPHHVELTLPKENDTEGWMEELTAGDRTRISEGMLANKGKYLVSISGNHQPLTQAAESWLRGRGV